MSHRDAIGQNLSMILYYNTMLVIFMIMLAQLYTYVLANNCVLNQTPDVITIFRVVHIPLVAMEDELSHYSGLLEYISIITFYLLKGLYISYLNEKPL